MLIPSHASVLFSRSQIRIHTHTQNEQERWTNAHTHIRWQTVFALLRGNELKRGYRNGAAIGGVTTPKCKAQQTNCDCVFGLPMWLSCLWLYNRLLPFRMSVSRFRHSIRARFFHHSATSHRDQHGLALETKWSTFDANDVRIFGFSTRRFFAHGMRLYFLHFHIPHNANANKRQRQNQVQHEKLMCLTSKRHTSTSTKSADENPLNQQPYKS